jgi:hypothetical protein
MRKPPANGDAIVTNPAIFELVPKLANLRMVKPNPEPGQLPGMTRPPVGNNPNVAPRREAYMAQFSYGDMAKEIETTPVVADPSGVPAWLKAQSAQPDVMGDVIRQQAARIEDGGVLYRNGQPSAQPMQPSPIAGRPYNQAIPKTPRNGSTGMPASPFQLMPSVPVEQRPPELMNATGAMLPVAAVVPDMTRQILGKPGDAQLPRANTKPDKGGRPSRPIN